jgi:membrane-associated HD superfamily phosphohydrolase
MQKDLYSPYNYAIQKTSEEIEEDKNEVLNSVLPVYQYDSEISPKSIEAFNSEFESKWISIGIDNNLKERYQALGNIILQKVYEKGIINPVLKYQRNGLNYNLSLINKNISTQLNTADVFNINSAAQFVKQQIKSDFQIRNPDWLIKLITNHLKANYVYNEILTEKLENDALNNISTTRGMVQKGELVIANGTMVNTGTYQKL